MKKQSLWIAAATLLSIVSLPAFAAVKPTQSDFDHGMVTGALGAEVQKVKVGKLQYNVIAVDNIEPAANPVQVLVNVYAPDLFEGDDPSVSFNLGIQTSKLVKVQKIGDSVLIRVSTNDIDSPSNTGYNRHETTFVVKYRQAEQDLSVDSAQ